MPKVNFVKSARKNNKEAGIKKGDSYYWWQNYRSPKRYSKTAPRPSQTVGSGFLQQVFRIGEQIEDLDPSQSIEDIKSQVESLTSELQDLSQEQEDKISNMPESLQQAPTGELLQNRADSLNEWIDELESALSGADDDTDDSEEDQQTKRQELIDALQSCSYNGE